jgi:2-dehydro-3-deoxygalactonokinase
MKKFISCDWGTSALRLRVVDIDKASVLAETASEQGIAVTFELWKQSGKQEDERLPFFKSILAEHTRKMEIQYASSLECMTLIISGMASSSMGMMELLYTEVPFSIGQELNVKTIEATDDFKHRILLISGIRTIDDAMRGEETQLIGCLNDNNKEDHLFIFPGTHSKHIVVKNGQVIDFKTYMTGEFFNILSRKSILSVSVIAGEKFKNNDSFEKGVIDGAGSNLLHSVFRVRTNDLFNKLSKQENYYYLSGLLIGTELRDVIESKHKRITLVVNEGMKDIYKTAMKILDIGGKESFEIENADAAIIKGQIKIWSNLNN